MKSIATTSFASLRSFASALCLSSLLVIVGCDGSDGDTGPAGPPGDSGDTVTDNELEPSEDSPGVVLEILGLSGGSGAGGAFEPGDTVSVHFTVEKDDGSTWNLSELGLGRTLISGPTFNYQRVLPEVTDVLTRATQNDDDSYTYVYASPIPATYAAPYNDTASFDEDDGELTGQALLSGTYTVGMYVRWNYTVDGETFRDVDNATYDFALGTVGSLQPREVVTDANCNACHDELQAHGGSRRDVVLCLMCHTSGSEDRNTNTVANGTPGVSIDFKVMIHKIHSAAHLPSVLGVSTNVDGTRNYAATPQPYEMIGFQDSLIDFSAFTFPVWPGLNIAMPRDQGYTALSSGNQTLENTMRTTGIVACDKCHGDPDGAGPLAAPAQGDLINTQPTERACGSCHDDIVWGELYTSNGQTMPETADDSNCTLCHAASGDSLAVVDAHTHPLLDPTFNGGINIAVTSVDEGTGADDDGTIDPGEKVELTFTIQDDAGTDVAASALASMSIVLAGPTSNQQILLNTSVPVAAVTGAQPYTIAVPQPVTWEVVGESTGSNGDVFTTSRTPHWNVSGGTTSVFVRTGFGVGNTTLAEDAAAVQNYIDVADATGFARDDYVVIDDDVANTEEYLKIQYVDGTRLWFGSLASTSYQPSLRVAHSAGAAVREVTLSSAKTVNTDYALDAAAGEITELVEFGSGNDILVSYTSDYVMPSVFPNAINDSPDLDETDGDWSGKPIADGTYVATLWGYKSLSLVAYGETNSYRAVSDEPGAEFLVGDASSLESWSLIDDASSCYACHNDLYLHGAGRRGFDQCIACHGAAGAEDRPPYVAGNAPDTSRTSVSFREMLHKIHMGKELANASSYEVVGFSSTAWPNNYSVALYDEVGFPTMPRGVQKCSTCHGADDESWFTPSDRDHPTTQTLPAREWRTVCSACHDADYALAHIDVQTSLGGAESCETCHGPDDELSIELVHKVR
ncbi:MAG: hypothetical protein IT453_19690 [Planctomycetes bacterium]|nr:hypothetical protein [Planctomycetota bacterium]